MQIDRSRFLVLTGALAAASLGAVAGASGCTIVTNNGTDASTPGPDGSTPGTDGSAAGDGSTNGDSAADASTCLGDDKVLNPSCASLAGDGGVNNCVQDPNIGQPACADFQAGLRNGVAREAVQCLVTLPTCEGLATDPVADCAIKAMKKSCPTTEAAALCKKAVADCAAASITPDVSEAECTSIASGLNAAGRQAFTDCATEGCSLVGTGCLIPYGLGTPPR